MNTRKYKKRSFLTESEKINILELYASGIGTYRMGKMLNRDRSTILKFLQKNVTIRHEKYRKYKFKNENYFDVIDTEDKAYFLGLLWADGCNFRKDKKGKQAYQTSISLQESDEDIIRLFAKKIYQNDDIVRYVDKNKNNHYDDLVRQNQYCLRIPSRHISDTLLNYGMEPRKSFTLELPKNIDFDENLWRAFIRGYYDGDGGISFNIHSKNYSVRMLSSVAFSEDIHEKIKDYTDINFNKELKKCYSQPMMSIGLHGNWKCREFLDWLYKDATIYLQRKYDKYQDLIALNNKLGKLPARPATEKGA